MSNLSNRTLGQHMATQAMVLGGLVALMWLEKVVDFFLGGQLIEYGVIPRQFVGLRGIVLAPFLHANFAHLIANTIPFICLGWCVMLRRIRDFFIATPVIMLVGGLATWLVGPSHSSHVGASGLVFGYLGFLLSRGYFERSLLWITLSLGTGFFYGGLIWGVLPGQPGISWQSHLFGLIGGIMAARLIAGKKASRLA